MPAAAVGDDIEIYGDASRKEVALTWRNLRQQNQRPSGKPNYCLSDFIAPADSNVGDAAGGDDHRHPGRSDHLGPRVRSEWCGRLGANGTNDRHDEWGGDHPNGGGRIPVESANRDAKRLRRRRRLEPTFDQHRRHDWSSRTRCGSDGAWSVPRSPADQVTEVANAPRTSEEGSQTGSPLS